MRWRRLIFGLIGLTIGVGLTIASVFLECPVIIATEMLAGLSLGTGMTLVFLELSVREDEGKNEKRSQNEEW
jgi:hypothetical protein